MSDIPPVNLGICTQDSSITTDYRSIIGDSSYHRILPVVGHQKLVGHEIPRSPQQIRDPRLTDSIVIYLQWKWFILRANRFVGPRFWANYKNRILSGITVLTLLLNIAGLRLNDFEREVLDSELLLFFPSFIKCSILSDICSIFSSLKKTFSTILHLVLFTTKSPSDSKC